LLLHFDKNTLLDIKNEFLQLNPQLPQSFTLGAIGMLLNFIIIFIFLWYTAITR